ncbi:MAG: metallophosphoesterase family protein, partial [Myxococcota bacterium]|nr:metallophosphoesterase family protein [Myxococcota bacterium]
MRSLAGLVLAGLCLSTSPALAEITRGPYLQDVRTDRADVVWEGTGFAAALVGYGLATPTEAFKQAICEGVHCYVRLEGLAPDATYVYQVFDGAEPISSSGSVTTAPVLAKPFRFLLYGDNRSDHDAHLMVIQAIVEDASLIVHSGDLVNSGEFESQWDTFFAIESDLLKDIPIYPAVGNHEEHAGDAPIFARLFHTPSDTSGSPFYYGFSWSNVRFLIIDGWINIVGWYECLVMGKVQNRCLSPEQEGWVLDELAAARDDDSIDHVFVVVHEGPYSSKYGRTGSAAMRALLDEFAISKVRMVLSGHDHYYEHGVSGNGLHYMISGGGGAPLYASTLQVSDLWPHEILSTMSVHNYQVIEVLGDDIHVISHDVDHNVILDDFWLGAPPACVDL